MQRGCRRGETRCNRPSGLRFRSVSGSGWAVRVAGAGLTHQPGISERSGKERLACIVPSGWLGIGHRLYHRAPGSFDLFRDVPTMTAIPEPTAAFPTQDSASILDHFAGLSDPRREQGRIHRLDEIVFMATCAV